MRRCVVSAPLCALAVLFVALAAPLAAQTLINPKALNFGNDLNLLDVYYDLASGTTRYVGLANTGTGTAPVLVTQSADGQVTRILLSDQGRGGYAQSIAGNYIGGTVLVPPTSLRVSERPWLWAVPTLQGSEVPSPFGSDGGWVYAVSSSGIFVGDTTGVQPFKYDSKTGLSERLSLPAGYDVGGAHGVADDGQIVGAVVQGYVTKPAIWQGTDVSLLFTPDGSNGHAWGIDSLGSSLIVGEVDGQAAYWLDGTLHYALFDGDPFSGQFRDVSGGFMVGYMDTVDGTTAIIYHDGWSGVRTLNDYLGVSFDHAILDATGVCYTPGLDRLDVAATGSGVGVTFHVVPSAVPELSPLISVPFLGLLTWGITARPWRRRHAR